MLGPLARPCLRPTHCPFLAKAHQTVQAVQSFFFANRVLNNMNYLLHKRSGLGFVCSKGKKRALFSERAMNKS